MRSVAKLYALMILLNLECETDGDTKTAPLQQTLQHKCGKKNRYCLS